MKISTRPDRRPLFGRLLDLAVFFTAVAPTSAMAGGILLYEFRSADVEPASAGTFGMALAYDQGFQDSSNVSPMFPADAAWRFGAAARQGTTPVLGGRGILSGACDDTGIFLLAVHGDWRL